MAWKSRRERRTRRDQRDRELIASERRPPARHSQRRCSIALRSTARQLDSGSASESSVRSCFSDSDPGRSIMGVLTLAATHGSNVQVEANGEDAERAVKAIEKLFDSRFNENE